MEPYSLQDAEADLRNAIDNNDHATIQALEPVIDELDVRTTATLLEAALWYASVGLHVFPLRAGTKIPLPACDRCRARSCAGAEVCSHDLCHGFKDATTNPDIITSWWNRYPAANIGIATGHLVDVIDIDGPTGVATWAELKDDLPTILGTVSTPRPGGNHLYVAAIPGRGNKAGLFPGIDYRGTGGYVVAPPSTVEAGPNPGAYTWSAPLLVAAAIAGAA